MQGESTYLCGGGVLTAAQILEQLRDYNPVYADMVQHIELGGGFALQGGATCGIGAKIITGVLIVLIIVAIYYSGMAALVLAQAKIIIGWLTTTSSNFFSSIASWASSSFNYVAGMFGVGKDAAQAAISANVSNATSVADAVATGSDLVPHGYLFNAKALIPFVGPQSVAITSDISSSSSSWSEYAWRLVQVVYSYLTNLFRVDSTVHGESIRKSVMSPSFTKFFASVCKTLAFTPLMPVINRFLQIVCDVTLGRAVTSHRVKEAVVETSMVCETPEFKRRMKLLSLPAGVRSSTRRSSRRDEIDMVREAYAPRKLNVTAAEREFVHKSDAQEAIRKRENAGEERMRAARAAHKRTPAKRTPTKRSPAKRTPAKRKHASSPARAPAKKVRKSPRRRT